MNKIALDKSLAFMRDWLRFQQERGIIPGFVVAVSHKGKVLFNEAYGYANLEKKEKLTPQHIFRVASHSKTFTATAIMQLQEQGKLKLDDHVVDYVPWLKQHKDKRFLNVTIRQILSHGAGIIRDGMDSNYWSLRRPFPDDKQLKEDILAADLVLDNNVKMKYSNYGYSLLGRVIEAVAGQSYNDYVKENIIKPLGLENTGPEYDMKIKDRLVAGHTRPDYKNKKRLPIANIDTHSMSSATGFYSTTEDLCQYFSAHIVGSKKLLNDESKKEMQRAHWQVENVPDKEEYGPGFDIEHTKKRRMFGHGGGFPGQSTKTLCDPKDQLVVIVLTNSGDGLVTYMAKSIVKLIDFFQYKWQPPENGIEKFEGRFMDLWSITDIVASGKKLIVGYSSWDGFNHPDELEHIKGNTFKIVKTSSFGSEGEPVEFKLSKSGQVETMLCAGSISLPEKVYLTETSKYKKIGEEFEPL